MDHKLLKSIIQTNWDIPCAMTKQITDTAWNIDDRYVLKKYDGKKELERNIILMETLGEKQIPTGEIIESISGLKYTIMHNNYFLLTKKLRGENVLSIKEHPGIAKQMGKIIGTLHNALVACEDKLDVWDNSLLGEMKGWIYESLKNSNWNLIREVDFQNTLNHLEELYDKLPKQLIHRDVHFGNFLFDKGKFSGYIDFDLSQRNIRIFDVCYFLLGLLTEEENKMSQREWLQIVRDTVDGYGEIAAITPEERKVIPYVMQSIEILFVAYFLNEGDEECAVGARDIYAMTMHLEL